MYYYFTLIVSKEMFPIYNETKSKLSILFFDLIFSLHLFFMNYYLINLINLFSSISFFLNIYILEFFVLFHSIKFKLIF